ncbi:hypothetical protein D3C86_2046010 [compost metagenome]
MIGSVSVDRMKESGADALPDKSTASTLKAYAVPGCSPVTEYVASVTLDSSESSR